MTSQVAWRTVWVVVIVLVSAESASCKTSTDNATSSPTLAAQPTSPAGSPSAQSPSPSAQAGLQEGEIELLPAYPTHVPPSVVLAVGVFPSTMRYGGEANVQGEASTTMVVTRFGEGHPAFSPTILIGSPDQEIDLTIENKTPALHNFSTVDEKIDRDFGAGESIIVHVVFPGGGYLFFFCKYHLQDSQTGAFEAAA
jgi:hypothetical protein